MDLLEVAPQPLLLPVLAAGGKAWISTYASDTSFWVEHQIGRRVCAWLDHIRQGWPEVLSADKLERQDVDVILAALVRLGIPEATLLEAELAGV